MNSLQIKIKPKNRKLDKFYFNFVDIIIDEPEELKFKT